MSREIRKPRTFGPMRPWKGQQRRRPVAWSGDPEAVTPAGKDEIYPLFAMGVVLGFLSLMICYRHGYLLLYGDAVAHLAIARRVVDAHYPGIGQLGGVWLPLPHVLMLPFIGNMAMWQTGLAAVPMSMLSFALSVAGIWRLARRLMRMRWAAVATFFYALNPNLLYLATTAMTEALFLALFIWSVVACMECVAALRAGNAGVARWRMVAAGLLIFLMVFTRYDGWIIGAVIWLCIAIALWKQEAAFKKRLLPWFVAFTMLCVAGPLLWFWYNAHFEHDWLDFLRGPYSAAGIDRKTSPAGRHYREWHNPWRALYFYMRCAQVDAAAWETGFGLMAAALYGVWVSWKEMMRAKPMSENRDMGRLFGLLLWLPLPFYVYSVAYGSVPIFIPQLYPHSYYNARYGMELLPALAVYGALAAERFELWLKAQQNWWKLGIRIWHPLTLLLCLMNLIGMSYFIPLVLKEGQVNSVTRVSLERSIAMALMSFPQDVPVMMELNDHVGAVQTAGRTLKSMVSDQDSVAFNKALADPAGHAAFIVALDGDDVAQAVKAHPQGLIELEVLCTMGQPCARVYQSDLWKVGTTP